MNVWLSDRFLLRVIISDRCGGATMGGIIGSHSTLLLHTLVASCLYQIPWWAREEQKKEKEECELTVRVVRRFNTRPHVWHHRGVEFDCMIHHDDRFNSSFVRSPSRFIMITYLLTRSLSSSGLAGGLLGTGHCEVWMTAIAFWFSFVVLWSFLRFAVANYFTSQ